MANIFTHGEGGDDGGRNGGGDGGRKGSGDGGGNGGGVGDGSVGSHDGVIGGSDGGSASQSRATVAGDMNAGASSPVEPTDADVERYDVLMHSACDFGSGWPQSPPLPLRPPLSSLPSPPPSSSPPPAPPPPPPPSQSPPPPPLTTPLQSPASSLTLEFPAAAPVGEKPSSGGSGSQ